MRRRTKAAEESLHIDEKSMLESTDNITATFDMNLICKCRMPTNSTPANSIIQMTSNLACDHETHKPSILLMRNEKPSP